MKFTIIALLLCIFNAKHAFASKCLVATGSADLCYNVQEWGRKLGTDFMEIDKKVQDTIYRSIDEGSKMLKSAVEYLKREVAGKKHTVLGTAPIESSGVDTDKANIENIGNEAVRTAMKEIFLEMVAVLKKRVSNSAYADSVATKLGFVFNSRRKRRATENLGNSIDGFVQASLPAINQTLVKAALKVQIAFNTVLDKFTQSLKLLLDGFVDINFDEVERNMETMVKEAGKTLIDSNISQIKQLFIDTSDNLYAIANIAKPYSNKLADVLEQAQERVKGAINHTMTRQVSVLIKRIDGAISTLKEYYKVLKALVA